MTACAHCGVPITLMSSYGEQLWIHRPHLNKDDIYEHCRLTRATPEEKS